MDIKERLKFFLELVRCSYNLYLWSYDSSFELLETDCPHELIPGDMIAMMGFAAPISAHIDSGNHHPLVLDTDFGLLWIAAFEYHALELGKIYILGPAFTGKNSHLIIQKKLDSYNLSIKLRSQIFGQIENVPIVPTATLMQYIVMLHYSITGERINADSVLFSTNLRNTSPEDIKLISSEHRGIWVYEQQFLKCIREGSPEYTNALEKCMSLSSGMKAELGDILRQNKNNLLVLLTLCSRASIEGGLNSSIAYTLNDYYAKRIEACNNTADTANLSKEMLGDYVQRVRDSKKVSTMSAQIQNACSYINTHLTEELSIRKLAKRLGYAEYYFSHKFKEETGQSINSYIMSRRVEEAKLLLSGTRMSIQEISDELLFGNRSYFYSCFQREVGMSPSEYRELNYKA